MVRIFVALASGVLLVACANTSGSAERRTASACYVSPNPKVTGLVCPGERMSRKAIRDPHCSGSLNPKFPDSFFCRR